MTLGVVLAPYLTHEVWEPLKRLRFIVWKVGMHFATDTAIPTGQLYLFPYKFTLEVMNV